MHGTGGNQINRRSNSENENKIKTFLSDDGKLDSKIESSQSIQHDQSSATIFNQNILNAKSRFQFDHIKPTTVAQQTYIYSPDEMYDHITQRGKKAKPTLKGDKPEGSSKIEKPVSKLTKLKEEGNDNGEKLLKVVVNHNTGDKQRTKAAECVENKSENDKFGSSFELFEQDKLKSSISSYKSSVNTLQSESTCVKLPKLCGPTKRLNLEGLNQKNDTTLLAKSQNVIPNSTTLKSIGVQTVSSQATKSTSTCSKEKRKKSNFKQDMTLPKSQSFREWPKQDSSDSSCSCCDSGSDDSQSFHRSQSSLTSCDDSYNYYTPNAKEGKRNARKSSRKERNSSRYKCKPNKTTGYHHSCLSCQRHNFNEKAVETCKPKRSKEICSIHCLSNTSEGDFVTWLKNVTEVWKDIKHFGIKGSCPPTQRSTRHVCNDPRFYTDEYTSSEVSEDNNKVTYSKCDNKIDAHKSKKDSKSSKRRSNINYHSRKHQPLKNTACYIRQGDNLDYRSKHSLSSKGFSNFQGDTSDHVADNIKEPKSSAKSQCLTPRRNLENISKADHEESGRYTQDDNQPMLPTNTQDQNFPFKNPHPKIKQPLLKPTFIHCEKGTTNQKIFIKHMGPQDKDIKNEPLMPNNRIKSTEMKSNNKTGSSYLNKDRDITNCDVNIETDRNKSDKLIKSHSAHEDRIFEGHINRRNAEGDYRQDRDGNDATHDIRIKGKLSGSLEGKMVDPKNRDVNTSSSSDSNDPGHRARKIFEALIKSKTTEGNEKSKNDEDTSCDDIIEELSENPQCETVDPKEDVNTPLSSDSINDPGYRARKLFLALIKGETPEGKCKNKDEGDTSCDDIIEELSENWQDETVDSKEDVNTPSSSSDSINDPGHRAQKLFLAHIKGKTPEGKVKNKNEDDTSCDDIIEELSENPQCETVDPREDVNTSLSWNLNDPRQRVPKILEALMKGKTAEDSGRSEYEENDTNSNEMCSMEAEVELSEMSEEEDESTNTNTHIEQTETENELKDKAQTIIDYLLKEVMKPSEGYKSDDPNMVKLDQKMNKLNDDEDVQILRGNITSLLGFLVNSSNNSLNEVESATKDSRNGPNKEILQNDSAGSEDSIGDVE